MSDLVTVENAAGASGVVVITLNDAARKNAMSEALADTFAAAVASVIQRDEARAVVVTGAGDAFSAGGDLAMLEQLCERSYAEARAHMLGFYSRFLCLLDVPVPTVAAVRGPAIGAGLCVATACDVMVAADDAVLAYNFVGLGLHPGMGATLLVPRKVGAGRASELLFSARRFSGADAAAWGLAQRTTAAEGVLGAAIELAGAIAAQGPQSVRSLKASLAIDRDALRMALEREASAQARSYASDELREGLRALRERRRPRF